MASAIVRVDGESMDRQSITLAGPLRQLVGPISFRLGTGRKDFHAMPLVPQYLSGCKEGRFRTADEIAPKTEGDHGHAKRRRHRAAHGSKRLGGPAYYRARLLRGLPVLEHPLNLPCQVIG